MLSTIVRMALGALLLKVWQVFAARVRLPLKQGVKGNSTTAESCAGDDQNCTRTKGVAGCIGGTPMVLLDHQRLRRRRHDHAHRHPELPPDRRDGVARVAARRGDERGGTLLLEVVAHVCHAAVLERAARLERVHLQ